jgi:hypothetical protein
MIERLEVISSHTPRHKPLYNSHRPLTREDFRRQRKVILEEIQSGLFLLNWYLWWLAEEERNKGRVCFQGKREKMNGNCNGRGGIGCVESEYIRRHHTHDDLADHQCSSALVKHIKAPVQLVKFLTFFPFNYSLFVYMCCMYWYVCVCFLLGFWFLGFLYVVQWFDFKCVLYVKILQVWIFWLVLIYVLCFFFYFRWLCMDHGVVFLILACLINQPLRLTSVWMLRKVRKRGETYVFNFLDVWM